MKYLFLILISIQSHADQWQCTDDQAHRDDNVWYSCGLGESSLEGQARAWALDSAVIDFLKVCDLSTDCRGLKRTVEPKRTTCTEAKGMWKCYRMIQVTVQDT